MSVMSSTPCKFHCCPTQTDRAHAKGFTFSSADEAMICSDSSIISSTEKSRHSSSRLF
jgi:hypothetical protein